MIPGAQRLPVRAIFAALLLVILRATPLTFSPPKASLAEQWRRPPLGAPTDGHNRLQFADARAFTDSRCFIAVVDAGITGLPKLLGAQHPGDGQHLYSSALYRRSSGTNGHHRRRLAAGRSDYRIFYRRGDG